MTTFGVYYSKTMDQGRLFDVPTHWKREEYYFLGPYEANNKDHLFGILNGAHGRNPLSASRLQEIISREKLHTSMSVGDVLIDSTSGKAYMCAMVGWTEVVEVI